MKIGVSSYSFQQLIDSGEETQLSIMKIAAEMGFDGIEFTDLIPCRCEREQLRRDDKI